MRRVTHSQLSRRERQIMDVIYRKGEAAAAEVLEELPDPPSYSAVRAMLRILEEKGHLTHVEKGLRYVFQPTVAREKARQSALQQLVQTFFDNSTENAVAALIHHSETQLSDEQLNRLAELIQDARQDLNGDESKNVNRVDESYVSLNGSTNHHEGSDSLRKSESKKR